MAQILPVIGAVAAVIAAGAAFYGNQQVQKLDHLRGTVGTSGAGVETFATTLRGQEAAVNDRMQALRAIAATPEMPVSGAQLQAQIDRLLSLRAEAVAVAADDPVPATLARSGELVAQARDTREALRGAGKGLPDAARAVLSQVTRAATALDSAENPAALQAALDEVSAAD